MMKLPPIGAQLIVFGKKYPIEDNFERIVDCLAEAGFKATEGGKKDPEETKRILAARGMLYAGSHATPRPLMEKLPDLIRFLHTVGAADICNSGLLDWKNETYDQTMATVEILNNAGRELSREGIKLHYHNHDFEFTKKFPEADGASMMDVLLKELDPAACDLCIDVAWVHRGGLDPVEFLKTHKDRTSYIHLKDWDGEKWTELGKGKVPIKACLDEIATNPKVRWIMWEEDVSPIDPFDAARESAAYLKSIGAI